MKSNESNVRNQNQSKKNADEGNEKNVANWKTGVAVCAVLRVCAVIIASNRLGATI